MRDMKNSTTSMMFAASALTTLKVTSLYQQQANTQKVRSIQNQTSDHSQSSICINDVCTNGTCKNNSCEHQLDV
jgi:hypothetical protein